MMKIEVNSVAVKTTFNRPLLQAVPTAIKFMIVTH